MRSQVPYILNGFIHVVPFAMLGMAKVGGSIAKSREEMKACNMVFYFLVGNVFFLSLISGSLLDETGQSVTHLNTIPSRLARTVSAQEDIYFGQISQLEVNRLSFRLLLNSGTVIRGLLVILFQGL
ncbi:hypothetical protein ACFE04_029125 [Oxalis oulophora]